jgi:hypothetical protein
MQKENFDLNKVKALSPIEAKQYVDKYFIPLTDGNHALLVNGKYEIYDDSVIKKTYFKRMSSELNKYYFQDKTDLKTITYDINKPAIFDNYLNLCPKIKQTYKKVDEFSKETKDKLAIILNYIKEILCSNKQDSYDFLLKWLSNMMRGNRNESALYLKGPQGAGKSTLLEFIRKHVLGNELCFQGGSGPLKSRFNSELSGKLMVVFEELENFSCGEWIAISSVLKRQITSPTLMIERKGQDPREEKNLNNVILISNNDAIQDDEGRRYNILDISTKYIGNKVFFNKLYSCFSDEVGQVFYSYLLEIDISNFDSQAYPMSKAKLDSFSKRLDSVYKFLKDTFILGKKDIKRQTVQELYDGYIAYCNKFQIKFKNKIDFNNVLADVNIKWKKSNGQNVYNITYEELNKISNKFHWVHELDEYRNCEADDEEDYDYDVDKTDKSVNINLLFTEKIEILEDENDDMRRYIKQLEKYVYELEDKIEEIDDRFKYSLSVLAKHKILAKGEYDYENESDNEIEIDFIPLSDNTFLNKKQTKRIKLLTIQI